jgi:hypothetical protein
MRRDDIDAYLRERGVGVLSLADGAETYAIPESFGYDGDALYFQFGYDDDSDKMDYVATTAVATFTVHTTDPARSVVARGPIAPVSDSATDRAAAALAANATIPNLNVSPDTADEDVDFVLYRLTPEVLSGRTFGTGSDPPVS